MLRGGEFLSLRKDEVFNLDGNDPYVFIPLERVKNRKHDLLQPLSSLAVEIIREALKDNDTDYVLEAIACQRHDSRTRCGASIRLGSTAEESSSCERRIRPGINTLRTARSRIRQTAHGSGASTQRLEHNGSRQLRDTSQCA